MTKYLLALFLLVPLLASAEGYGGNNANANAGAISASGSTANQGNAQNINFNTDGNGSMSLRTTPDVIAPSFGVSAPCSLAMSGGVSIMGFGGSFGKAYTDDGCTRRETARVFYQLGKINEATKMMCFDKEAAQVLGVEFCTGIEAK